MLRNFKNLINERPLVREEVDKILIKINCEFEISLLNSEICVEDGENECAEEDISVELALNENEDISEFTKTNFKIKDESHFTKFFFEIYSEFSVKVNESDLSNLDGVGNKYFSQNFIEKILLDIFFPYAFIWSGITCRDSNYIMTRWTNGTAEKHIGTCKSKERSHLNIEPAQYVLCGYKTA